MRNRWWAAPVLAAAVVGLAACGSTAPSSSSTTPASPAAAGGSSSSSSPAASSGSGSIKTAKTSVGTVLENSKGLVIYWFVPDTTTKSNCNGSCAAFWPPVPGPATAVAGAALRPGLLGTIKRADGTTQATFRGHPLYTFKGDPGPGKATGNGTNASGGLWYAMTPSGAKPMAGGAAPQPSTSTSSSGGYGY
jgi:predicted lipoprotein with Yx(FWY)xxD motif